MTGFSTSKINSELLPIKIHYFLLYSALSGVLPFLPLVAKQVGISATAVGIILAIIPFTISILKPVFGIIVDRSHKLILILELLILAFLVVYTVSNYIPAIKQVSQSRAELICKGDLIHLSISQSCESEKDYICSVYYDSCGNVTTNQITCISNNYSSSILKASNISNITSLELSVNNTDSVCNIINVDNCKMLCQNDVCKDFADYNTTQFWLFLILYVIGGVCSDAVMSLSDAACYEMIQTQTNSYGRQRIWGTIGWGAFAPLIGYLVDVVSYGKFSIDYSPAFYSMIVLMLIDMPVVWKIPVSMSRKSPDILKDIGKILSDFRIDAYISAVFFVGALTALQWNYSFWYLEDLGGSKLLLGLTMAVECFAAECPILFFSGWMIKKIGHEATLTLALGAYALRFFCTSYVRNVWYFLILAVLHGPAFGLFYAAMTAFAKDAAAKGTEATLQCILGGAFTGLGVAVGSILAGYAFDKIGGELTFRYAGILAAIVCVFYSTLHIYVRRKIRKLEDYETAKNVRRFSAQWVDLGERKFQPSGGLR